MNPLFLTTLAFGQMCALDYLLTICRFQGTYYAIHAIHNTAIAFLTAPDVINSFTNFSEIHTYPINYDAASLVFALHFYHIAIYRNKFKTDDWLHHILMIFVALPIGLSVPSGSLLGYSLFFTTGAATILDYILLFGVRNGWLHPLTEKRVNHQLQLWIRAPGAVSHATLTIAFRLIKREEAVPLLAWIPPILTYWNGLYFADQVIADHTRRRMEQEIPLGLMA
jgi:hypothetical protein